VRSVERAEMATLAAMVALTVELVAHLEVAEPVAVAVLVVLARVLTVA